MSKTYNLGNPSDMKRLSRDLEQKAMNIARDKVSTMNFDHKCPHCGSSIQVHSGLNFCPVCQKQINVDLNINFEI